MRNAANMNNDLHEIDTRDVHTKNALPVQFMS